MGLKSNSILTSIMSALQMNLSPRAQKFEAVRNKVVSQFFFPFFATLKTQESIRVNAGI